MITWGGKVTQIRATFARRAAAFEEDGGLSYDGDAGEKVKLPRSLQRRYTTKRRGLISLDEPAVKDEDLSFNRRKKKTFWQLTLREKVDIAGDVFLEK